jgi:hypothetical protein
MADNVTITEGSGTQIAADEVGGVKYQRVKVSHGIDGVAVDTSTTDPLPVTITDNPLPVSISNNPTFTEESLGMIQAALQTLIGSLPLTYSASIPKAAIVFGTDSSLPTLPTLANVTTVNSVTGVTTVSTVNSVTGVTTVSTVSNITNIGAIPASQLILDQQLSAYCSFISGVVKTT